MTVTVSKQTMSSQQQTAQQDPPLLQEKLELCSPQCAGEIRAYTRDHNNLITNNIGKMWAQGRRVQNLRSDADYRKPKRGTTPINPLQIIAEVVGCTEGYLNKQAQLYRAFPTEADRTRLLSYRMARSGKPLTWGHWEQLLKLHADDGDTTQFEEAIRRTVSQDLKPEEVDLYIKRLRVMAGAPASRGGGRPTHVPPTLDGRCTRLTKQTDVLLRNAGEIYENPQFNFLTSLKEMSQGKVAENAKDLRIAFETMQENLTRLRDFCDKQATKVMPAALAYIEECERSAAQERGRKDAKALETADAAG